MGAGGRPEKEKNYEKKNLIRTSRWQHGTRPRRMWLFFNR